MELWLYARKLIVALLVIIAGFLLQCSVFSHFEIAGVMPNVMIIIVSVFGFMRGSRTGLFVGFVSGLLLDIFGSGYFGMFTLIYLLIGYFNGVFRSFFYGSDVKLPLVFIAISDLLYGAMMFLMLLLVERRYDPLFYFSGMMLREAVYTVAVAFFLYFPLYRLDGWLDKAESRSTKIIG